MVTLTGQKLWGMEIATDPTVPYGNVLVTNTPNLVGSPTTITALLQMPAERQDAFRKALEDAGTVFPE